MARTRTRSPEEVDRVEEDPMVVTVAVSVAVSVVVVVVVAVAVAVVIGVTVTEITQLQNIHLKEKMTDGPISELTITEPGHRPSQFKKISDVLPVLCTDQNYQGLDEVLRTGCDPVETDLMPDYLDANL